MALSGVHLFMHCMNVRFALCAEKRFEMPKIFNDRRFIHNAVADTEAARNENERHATCRLTRHTITAVLRLSLNIRRH